jgi:hypothetical protein
MYTLSELLDHVDNFEKMTQQEKVKTLAFFYTVKNNADFFTPGDIKNCFISEKLKSPANINREFSNLTAGKTPVFLKRVNNYLFERNSKRELEELYLGKKNNKIISSSLRSLLPKIVSLQQRTFLEECIKCFEIGAFRSSIVMSWLLTLDVIFEYIIKLKTIEFNAAIQSHGKYKKLIIVKKEDLNDIKESDFIELLRVSKIASNDIRKILDEKLNFRNTCAHPNTIIIKDSKAISFIEDIVENVLLKYID